MMGTLRTYLASLLHSFYPRRCVVCGTPLVEGEQGLCTQCVLRMPRTGYHTQEGNPVEVSFWGRAQLERATSYFFYEKGSDFRHLLHRLKYGGRKDLGYLMGRVVATELRESDFLEDIDLLLPVPLHPRKQRERGYNQSACLAKGLSQVTGIPVNTTSLIRRRHHESQTHKRRYDRWLNVDGIFALRHPERLAGKHLLLIDDVLTTGATITACCDALKEVEGVRISVFTLAVAQ